MTSILMKAQLKVFIAHGKHDAVLRLGYAGEAKDYLQDLTPDLGYHEYEMGHTIIERELDDLAMWLQYHYNPNLPSAN